MARGDEVYSQVQSLGPDLLLLDVDLPGADGLEVVRRLKADEKTWRLPVLALSGYVDEATVERFSEAGFDGYELNPLDFERLVAAIVRLTVE